jgi:hypothetical protein
VSSAELSAGHDTWLPRILLLMLQHNCRSSQLHLLCAWFECCYFSWSCPAGMSCNLPLSLFLDLIRSLRRRSKFFARLVARSSSTRRRLTYEPYQPLYTPLLQFDADDDDEVCLMSRRLLDRSQQLGFQLTLATELWRAKPDLPDCKTPGPLW